MNVVASRLRLWLSRPKTRMHAQTHMQSQQCCPSQQHFQISHMQKLTCSPSNARHAATHKHSHAGACKTHALVMLPSSASNMQDSQISHTCMKSHAVTAMLSQHCLKIHACKNTMAMAITSCFLAATSGAAQFSWHVFGMDCSVLQHMQLAEQCAFLIGCPLMCCELSCTFSKMHGQQSHTHTRACLNLENDGVIRHLWTHYYPLNTAIGMSFLATNV